MSRGGTKIKPPFQFTPLREGRHILRRVLRAAGISIHAPPRGATESAATGSAEQEFQFTPLREGRRCGRFESRVGYCISIHAPPRGATALRGHRRRKRRISIHAPPRGATPRASRCAQAAPISIHAPPRGATAAASTMAGLSSYFNSRPSARGDAHPHSCIRTARIFQFTPLREGRPPLLCLGVRCSCNFNSRPSARGDQRIKRYRLLCGISIHAPPRGATCEVFLPLYKYIIFQFTPLREGRPITAVLFCFTRISIHAPPRGATAKDMQFLQIFCSTLTNQHGLTIVPRNLSRLFW